jgi:hypothetical protein
LDPLIKSQLLYQLSSLVIAARADQAATAHEGSGKDRLADDRLTRQPRSVGGAGYKGATKVVALPFALLSVEAGRDTDGTLAVRKKTKPLKFLALPRGLEPLFSP